MESAKQRKIFDCYVNVESRLNSLQHCLCQIAYVHLCSTCISCSYVDGSICNVHCRGVAEVCVCGARHLSRVWRVLSVLMNAQPAGMASLYCESDNYVCVMYVVWFENWCAPSSSFQLVSSKFKMFYIDLASYFSTAQMLLISATGFTVVTAIAIVRLGSNRVEWQGLGASCWSFVSGLVRVS